MNTYDVGDRIVVVGKFITRSGDAISPDVVACMIKYPDGTVETYTYGYLVDPIMEEVETGRFEIAIDITQYGKHYYYWYATGTGKAAGENSFNVRKSSVLEVL